MNQNKQEQITNEILKIPSIYLHKDGPVKEGWYVRRNEVEALLIKTRQEAIEEVFELVNKKVIGENEEKPVNSKADEPLEVIFRNLHRTNLRIRLTKQKNRLLKALSLKKEQE